MITAHVSVRAMSADTEGHPKQSQTDQAQSHQCQAAKSQKSDTSHFICSRTSSVGSVSRPTLPKPLLTLPRVTRRPPPPPPSGLRRVLNFLGVFGCLQVGSGRVYLSQRRLHESTNREAGSSLWSTDSHDIRLFVHVQNAPGIKSVKRGSWFNPETLINEKVRTLHSLHIPCVSASTTCLRPAPLRSSMALT